jgi:hypothetical protein
MEGNFSSPRRTINVRSTLNKHCCYGTVAQTGGDVQKGHVRPYGLQMYIPPWSLGQRSDSQQLRAVF